MIGAAINVGQEAYWKGFDDRVNNRPKCVPDFHKAGARAHNAYQDGWRMADRALVKYNIINRVTWVGSET